MKEDSDVFNYARAMLLQSPKSYAELGRLVAINYPLITPATWRGFRKNNPEVVAKLWAFPVGEPQKEGALALDESDGQAEWKRLKDLFLAKSKKEGRENRLEYASPVGIALLSDTHIGSSGTDYSSLYEDTELILHQPNVRVAHFGDLWDNMIPGKLLQSRLAEDGVSIESETLAGKWWLERVRDRLDMVLSGNHDLWTKALSGQDILLQTLRSLKIDTLYDTDELHVRIVCGKMDFMLRGRHLWRGGSSVNPSRFAEHNFASGYRQAKVYVGGHLHNGVLVREFRGNNESSNVAVQLGTYKKIDGYAKSRGFPEPLRERGAVIILHPEWEEPMIVSGIRRGVNMLKKLA